MNKLPESPKDVAKYYWSKRFTLQEKTAKLLLIAIAENSAVDCPELEELKFKTSSSRKYCWITKITPDTTEIQDSLELTISECYDDLIEVMYEPARYDSATIRRNEQGVFEVTLTK